MYNSSLVAITQYFWWIRTSVLYGNRKKFNTETVNDYPAIRFQIRFERKFPIAGLYFLTLHVETLQNLCPVEMLFGIRMAGLCQFYWGTCYYILPHKTLLFNCRYLYIFLYKSTIYLIVYVAYEQKEVEKMNVILNKQHQQLQQLQTEINILHHEHTETDNGMILYYYTIYTTLF